jgi:hypothetical protein
MVIIGSLSADILPGYFLLAYRERCLAVCQVKDFIIPDNVKVVWWMPPVLPQPLCPIKFENLHKCRGQELSPSTSSVIKRNDVIEIAFVFSAELLEELWVDFAGI